MLGMERMFLSSWRSSHNCFGVRLVTYWIILEGSRHWSKLRKRKYSEELCKMNIWLSPVKAVLQAKVFGTEIKPFRD